MKVQEQPIGTIAGPPDVTHNFAMSSGSRTVCTSAAHLLAGQRGSRSSYRSNGLTEFNGHFSALSANGARRWSDLDAIVAPLRLVATKVSELDEAARAENRRRVQVREWVRRLANRDGWD